MIKKTAIAALTFLAAPKQAINLNTLIKRENAKVNVELGNANPTCLSIQVTGGWPKCKMSEGDWCDDLEMAICNECAACGCAWKNEWDELDTQVHHNATCVEEEN